MCAVRTGGGVSGIDGTDGILEDSGLGAFGAGKNTLAVVAGTGGCIADEKWRAVSSGRTSFGVSGACCSASLRCDGGIIGAGNAGALWRVCGITPKLCSFALCCGVFGRGKGICRLPPSVGVDGMDGIDGGKLAFTLIFGFTSIDGEGRSGGDDNDDDGCTAGWDGGGEAG